MEIKWPELWKPISDEEWAKKIEASLQRVLPEGHVLYGKKVKLIASTSVASDEHLFQLENGEVADVDLMYKRDKFSLPFPATTIHESLGKWAEGTSVRD